MKVTDLTVLPHITHLVYSVMPLSHSEGIEEDLTTHLAFEPAQVISIGTQETILTHHRTERFVEKK